jgi:hypothetical protein
MANVKISALPEYTGNTYNGYFVWNDSGETQTYKTKYSTGLSYNLFLLEGNIQSTDNKVSIGSNNNLTNFGGSWNNNYVIGSNNTINYGNNATIIGTSSSLYAGFGDSLIGVTSVIFGAGNSGGYNILGSSSCNFTGNWHDRCIGVGMYSSNVRYDDPTHRGRYAIFGTDEFNMSAIDETQLGKSGRALVLGGYLNKLKSDAITLFPVLIGGSGNTLSDVNNTTILNCFNINLSGVSNTHFIGVNGYTGTTADTSNDTTYTQNHASLGQSYNGYYDNGSGSTFTIDWNNGNSQKVFMTGDTSLTFTNVNSGGQYTLQVVNGGTHSITAATASGFTILCEGGSIPNITNNGVDLCILEGMGTDLLVRHFAGFAAP